MLLNSKYEFLDHVFEKLRVFCPAYFDLFDPSVNTKQSRLI